MITHSIVMRSKTGTVRVIETEHYLQAQDRGGAGLRGLRPRPADDAGAGGRALGQRPLLALARPRRGARARDQPAHRPAGGGRPDPGRARRRARRRAGVHRSRGCATRCPTRRICTTSTARCERLADAVAGRRAGRPARRLRRRRRDLARAARALSAGGRRPASRSTCPIACARATAPTRRRSSASRRRAAGWW